MIALIAALQKNYEFRSNDEHSRVLALLSPLFPSISKKAVKLISFYVQLVKGPQVFTHKQLASQSYIITGLSEGEDNPEGSLQIQQINHSKNVSIGEGGLGVVLDYLKYLNCMSLGEGSIEEEISFMHSSELLCSIPKKRLYYILRQSKILHYSISQPVYFEGQAIENGQSGSGVYLVRRGEFGYYKELSQEVKQIETLRFNKGHIFGSLELQSRDLNSNRKFTVKCKSHHGLVYNFSEQIFNAYIKPYCEGAINSRQTKLLKYMDTQFDTITKIRSDRSPFLSQTLTKGFSNTNKSNNNDLPLLIRTRLSVPEASFSSTKMSLSQRIEEEGIMKNKRMSLSKETPLQHYPMASQRCNFTDSEFRELQKLKKDREKCDKIRDIKFNNTSSSKGEILFSFFRNTWVFDKEKKLGRRYQKF